MGKSTVLNGLRSLASRRASAGTVVATAAVVGLGALALKLGSMATAGGQKPDAYAGKSYTFPDDLSNLDHWISFTAVETKGKFADQVSSWGNGLTNISGQFGISGGSMFLPMPSNLSTDYLHGGAYTEQDLGAAGAMLKPGDRSLYGNQGDMAGVAEFAGAAAGATAAVAGALGGNKFLGVGSGGFTDAALKVGGGIAQNPNKIVLFKAVPFRDHSFSWKLSPKNRQESDTIQGMIKMMRFYAHPEFVGGGLFFKYPEFFHIRFNHPEYLFDLRPSVCTDIKVNYHSQGYPAYIRDKDGGGIPAPAEVELTLSFKEVEIITKNSLAEGFN